MSLLPIYSIDNSLKNTVQYHNQNINPVYPSCSHFLSCFIHICFCGYVRVCVCVHAKLLQWYPTLCNPTDCSPTGSSVLGILQACPSPGDPRDPVIEPMNLLSPALAGGFFTTSSTWEASRVCLVPGSFISCRPLCIYHHSQDRGLHHHKNPLCCPFVITLIYMSHPPGLPLASLTLAVTDMSPAL